MTEAEGAAVDRLIALMARLPGLGPRSARRAVLAMIRKRALLLDPLAKAMAEAAAGVRECSRCGNITTAEICAICADPRRATGEICVVETVADLWAMERAGIFGGLRALTAETWAQLGVVGRAGAEGMSQEPGVP